MTEPKGQLVADRVASDQQVAPSDASRSGEGPAGGDPLAVGACASPEHRLLSLVLESISFPLYVIDVQTHAILLANPATSQGPLAENTTCYALTHGRDTPCDSVEAPCPITAVCRTKRPVVMEHVHVSRSGTPRHYEIHAFPICDAAGNVTQIIEYNMDVTDRRHAEEEVRNHQKSLEAMVAELQRSNEELRELSAIAAHDMRSPLAGVSTAAGALERILRGKLNEREKRVFDILLRAVDRTSDVIASVYRCGQVTSAPLQRAPVDLNRIVHELRGFQLRTELESTRGAIHVPAPLHVIAGDEVQILELMQNLIANGLKYHREGIPPEVTVRSYRAGAEGIRIEVEDNGLGIHASDYDNVFLMFKRLDNARHRDGLGIGLAFCKRVVERHGGRLGVRSTYGAGSTFWVELPSADPAHQHAASRRFSARGEF